MVLATNTEKLERVKAYLRSTSPNESRGESLLKDKKILILTRDTIKRRISTALEIVDRHTISGWINKLRSENIIEENPHSALSINKRLHKPSDDTRYIIHLDLCTPTTHHTLLTKWLENKSQI